MYHILKTQGDNWWFVSTLDCCSDFKSMKQFIRTASCSGVYVSNLWKNNSKNNFHVISVKTFNFCTRYCWVAKQNSHLKILLYLKFISQKLQQRLKPRCSILYKYSVLSCCHKYVLIYETCHYFGWHYVGLISMNKC